MGVSLQCVHRGLVSLVVLIGVAIAAPAMAGPAVATKWRDVGESQVDCVAHAASAIRRLGFEVGDFGSQSSTGRNGDYTASIRCISDKQIAFFVMSGPEPAQVTRLLDLLYQRF
jgi:hypothetical protein